MSDTKRAALYIRVSTEEQARHGLSLDEQKKALTDYAAKNHYDIMGIYADEGATARKAISRRKELQRLLHDVQADLVDVILFIKLDRWFRNVKDFYAVQTILDAHNVEWNAILEDYNTQTSAGRLNLNIRLSIAQNESDQTADRIRFVFEGKKKRHEALTGTMPLGYSIKDKHIVPNADAPKVLDLFQHFLAHPSIIDTMEYGREKYGFNLRRISYRRIFANPAYIGTFYGVPEYAPPIVPREMFDRANAIINERKRLTAPRAGKLVFLFSGLIHCPVCHHIMIGTKGHKYKNQTEYMNKHYRCPTHMLEKTCPFSGTIFERPLERYLLDHLQEKLAAYQIELDTKRKKSGEEEHARQVASIRSQLTRLKDLYVNGFIDRDTYVKDFDKYNDKLTAALKTAPVKTNGMRENLQDLMNNKDWRAMYENLTPKAKKDFWASILLRIDVTHYERGRDGKKEFALTFVH